MHVKVRVTARRHFPSIWNERKYCLLRYEIINGTFLSSQLNRAFFIELCRSAHFLKLLCLIPLATELHLKLNHTQQFMHDLF